MNVFERGWEIEKALGGWGNNFPTIDCARKTVRTGATYLEDIKSIKSIDITAPSYQYASVLRNRLRGYTDDLASFQAKPYKGTDYIVMPGTRRTLEIAVPPVEMTAEQAGVFQEMVEYGRQYGVDIVTRIVQ